MAKNGKGRKDGKVSRDRAILDAAAKLFHERGFAAVGVDEIGEKAGVTGPAIYRHFESKDEILATLFDEALDGLFAKTGGSFEDPMEEIEHRARAHVEYTLSQRRLASVLFREDRSIAPKYRRRLHRRERDYIEAWIELVERAFPGRDRDELVASVHAALGLMTSVAHWPKDAFEADDIPGLAASMVIAALGAGRAATVEAAAAAASGG